MKVPLCKLDAIPNDGVKKIDFFGREALVLKVDGRPQVVLNICMHLGGPMKREDGKLVCEWHGAEFDCGTWTRLKGPARRGARLITLPVRVENGTLMYTYGE